MKKLKVKLDKIFSQYIRQKYADDNGYVHCVTCGTVHHWKKIQAGHFHSRRYLSIRWDEKNVFPQCVSCNIYKQGEQVKMYQYIDKIFGKSTLEMLEIKKNNICKMGKFEYEVLIKHYTEKLKNL